MKSIMEKLSLIERNAVSILLMNAVCAAVKNSTGSVDNLKEIFGIQDGESSVDVEMKINGVVGIYFNPLKSYN
jgi:hypothetical protein